jgi:hypothetical protein
VIIVAGIALIIVGLALLAISFAKATDPQYPGEVAVPLGLLGCVIAFGLVIWGGTLL